MDVFSNARRPAQELGEDAPSQATLFRDLAAIRTLEKDRVDKLKLADSHIEMELELIDRVIRGCQEGVEQDDAEAIQRMYGALDRRRRLLGVGMEGMAGGTVNSLDPKERRELIQDAVAAFIQVQGEEVPA